MNVERLHRILINLNDEMTLNNYLGLIQQVQTHLQNLVNQPNQPTHQTNLVNSLNTLYEKLQSSRYDSFPPSWKQIISEISGSNLFGLELKNKIETIFSSNTITPAKALEDIKKIFTNLQAFQTAVKNILTGFKTLNIEKEDLEQGECEFGYMIPREHVANKLSEFKNEIDELNFILTHISEAVTGEKGDFKVKTISSSDFLLYIIIGIQVANVLSTVVEKILNYYKQILEIKVLRNQLNDKGVPQKETEGIENYANNLMKKGIEKIAKEIISNYVGDSGRKNELKNALIIALNKLANRIDNGFNVEIRIEPLPEPNEEEIDEETKEKINLMKQIQERAKNIEFIETEGKSILSLPEDKKLKD